MNPLTRALIVYSLQVGVLIAACALGARLVDLAYPRARLAYWRAVITLSLLLPLWPVHVVDVPVQAPPVAVVEPSPTIGVTPSAVVRAQPEQPQRHRAPAVNWLPVLIAAGVAARLAWLATGLFALRRLAAGGEPVSDTDMLMLQRQIAPEATVRWHDGVGQPVTFGAGHPIVLLPRSLRVQTEEIRRAALCHELFHAARGDWAAGLLEESIASLFWFHPAMRWAIGQVQLCREQQVDELSIIASGSRRGYLQALFEFAGRPAIRTAEAFGHSRQLASRIKHLSREIVMSHRRFGISAASLGVLLSLGVWSVASAFPLRTELRYHATTPRISAPASEARQLADPAPAIRPVEAQATTRYQSPQPSAPTAPSPDNASWNDFTSRTREKLTALQASLATMQATQQLPRPSYPSEALKYGVGATIVLTASVSTTGTVVDIVASQWTLTVTREVQDVGYWVTAPQKAFIDACTDAMRGWKTTPGSDESALKATFTFSANGPIVTSGVERRAKDGTLISSQHGGFGTRPANPIDQTAVRVGGDVHAPRPLAHIAPVYPDAALAAGVSGVVIVEVTLDETGSVADAKILRSIPLLDQAALDAVKQWTYEPVLLNGVPTSVIMTVTVNFASHVF